MINRSITDRVSDLKNLHFLLNSKTALSCFDIVPMCELILLTGLWVLFIFHELESSHNTYHIIRDDGWGNKIYHKQADAASSVLGMMLIGDAAAQRRWGQWSMNQHSLLVRSKDVHISSSSCSLIASSCLRVYSSCACTDIGRENKAIDKKTK